MDKLDLTDFFKTKTQANDFANRLSTIAEATYQTDFNLEKTLMDQIGIEKKDKLMALLRDNQVNIQSAATLKAFLDKLRESIATLPLVPLKLAFEPKEQTLKALTDWFMLNINKQVVFDISIDRSLIAGAAITYNGKFMDFSARAKFDQIVKKIIEKPIT